MCVSVMWAENCQHFHINYCYALSVDCSKLSFSVEGQDFTIIPPDVFEVIFPPGTMNGTTRCDPCSIINDDNLEGDHSFFVHIQTVTPDLMGITTDPQYTTVEITDNEGEWCSQQSVDW